jgi:glutamate/tyrosine decarboxylase-like PLP-dependent enzyme
MAQSPMNVRQLVQVSRDAVVSWREVIERGAVDARGSERGIPDPRDAHGLEDLANAVIARLRDDTLHATHPRFFGLFVTPSDAAGVLGDVIAAVTNPQLGAVWHARAAAEIETVALRHLQGKLGLPDAAVGTFTTGGSEANLTGILCALTRAFPERAERGLGTARPVFYASEQAHDSFVKIAAITGLGRAAVRRIRSDARQRLDPHALRAAIHRDRAEGCTPFAVVGTAGTTATGAFDPLEELAAICAVEDLWLHVDAAWGGIAALSDRLRPHLQGIERADSVTWDAHKTLPVPTGAGMFFARERTWAERVFATSPGYVPADEHAAADPYRVTLQWSRRFIGLKVYLCLAERGEAGIARMVDHQAAMGRALSERLREAGCTITNDSPLPLVTFTHPEMPASDLARRVVDEGAAWISSVAMPNGATWARACITHPESGLEDVEALAAAVRRACSPVNARSASGC